MSSKAMEQMTPTQRLDLLCQLWSALDLTGQTVLLRLAWALASSLDDAAVKAIGRVVGLVANDNESPDNTIATC